MDSHHPMPGSCARPGGTRRGPRGAGARRRPGSAVGRSVGQGWLRDGDAASRRGWVNGERRGVMVGPGMTSRHGQPVGRLEGPLRWAVDVSDESSAAIAGPLPLPAAAATQ